MSTSENARRVRRLAEVLPALERGEGLSITRLTVLKGLCEEPAEANRFVLYLARKTLERYEHGQGRSKAVDAETRQRHRRLMLEAVRLLEEAQDDPGREDMRERLHDLLRRVEAEQNTYERIRNNPVRIIHDQDLLTVEYALHCTLDVRGAGTWAYQTARHYAERYSSRYATGLIPDSIPSVRDIVDYWKRQIPAGKGHPPRTPRKKPPEKPAFTPRQGQFLAFLHLYRKLHRQSPSEAEMQMFFRVTPPAVHDMIVKLASLGLIERQPGVARSARVLLPPEQLPALEDVEGPPW